MENDKINQKLMINKASFLPFIAKGLEFLKGK
jgi:hypothetical protein